jgi:hypothetical protein
MVIRFELREMGTANAIGDYHTEAAALAVVRDTALARGREAVRTFALVRVNTPGRATTIALDAELARRALAASPYRPPVAV